MSSENPTVTPPVEPVLLARGLERWLGQAENRAHVLRGVDIALQPGLTYAVVGPSGCGKSTLLYLLGLLDRPDGGEIRLRGELVDAVDEDARSAARARHLGFVFQFHFLLSEFTALDNVLLPMRKLGALTPEAMEARGRALLQAVGLGDKAGRRANHLSGGEMQRVAIARALANRPALLLADEPTGNLDAANSDRIFDLLRSFAREERQAVLMVTHNPELAGRCDHRFHMRDGRFVGFE